MPRVSSRDNPRLKALARLAASSRERRKTGRCVLEGEHLIAAYCARYGAPETLVVCETALDRPEVKALLAQLSSRDTLVVPEDRWPGIAQLPQAVGALAVVTAPTPVFRSSAEFCLLLQDVQDPGNVGSILRSAAAAGVAQVFLSPGCAFAWSPKVLRGGQGGHFHLDIFENVDLLAWAGDYQGNLVAAVAAGGEPLFDTNLSAPVAIAIGNEGAGLSAALRAAATHRVSIPMPGCFESLNAAAAAAVCLFECVRQRSAVSC
jgi:TrmH family RNA methyltransferase